MYTRQTVRRNYGTPTPEQVSIPGFVKAELNNNIVNTWPIMRPVAGWSATSASLVSDGYPENMIIRGGATALQSLRPRVEMDPSDPRTWQRSYLFST
jgi:hypothetical protein